MLSNIVIYGAIIVAILAIFDSKISLQWKKYITSFAETTWIKLSYIDVFKRAKIINTFVSFATINLTLVYFIFNIKPLFYASAITHNVSAWQYVTVIIILVSVYLLCNVWGGRIISKICDPILKRSVRLLGVADFLIRVIIYALITIGFFFLCDKHLLKLESGEKSLELYLTGMVGRVELARVMARTVFLPFLYIFFLLISVSFSLIILTILVILLSIVSIGIFITQFAFSFVAENPRGPIISVSLLIALVVAIAKALV
jgi:hypothetical protein